MITKIKSVITTALIILVVTTPVATRAAEEDENSTPFNSNSQYVQVADKIFVYDRSQFKSYKGPNVSNWKLGDYIDERKRLGLILLAPSRWIYIDVLHDPEYEYYELRDVKSGKLILEMKIYDGLEGGLLFNGQGSMYKYDRARPLCEPAREIRKFSLTNDKLTEVKQPFVLLKNLSTTATTNNSTLHSEPTSDSPTVATLEAETTVQVLSQENGWLLVVTPLGLTGWVPKDVLSHLYACG